MLGASPSKGLMPRAMLIRTWSIRCEDGGLHPPYDEAVDAASYLLVVMLEPMKPVIDTTINSLPSRHQVDGI